MAHPVQELNDAAANAGLEYLMVGGHAVALYGYPRFTRDLDLLIDRDSLDAWKILLQKRGYRSFFESAAFIQFSAPSAKLQPVDLVLVDAATWEKMSASAVVKDLGGGLVVKVPDAKHLIAMKLRAAQSATRRVEAQDWEDIVAIVEAQGYSLSDPEFRELVRRFGGESALGRLERRHLFKRKPASDGSSDD